MDTLQMNEWLNQPHIMELIGHKTFIADGPIKLNRLKDEEYLMIPLFRQVGFLCKTIDSEGSVKLTTVGNLPLRIVSSIYSLGIPDSYYEKYPTKLRKETDSYTVHMARLVAELAGLYKKQSNSLVITKKGKDCLSDKHRLLQAILVTLGYKLSWGYFDGYEDKRVGQYGFGFSVLLLGLFGDEKRESQFYSDKYFGEYRHLCYDEGAHTCFSFRIFERFLKNLGMVEVDGGKSLFLNEKCYICKSEFFDKLISIDENYGKIAYASERPSSDSKSALLHLRVSLNKSNPLIWRDFIVPADISLELLHVVLQAVMGWENYHLHMFIKGGKMYSKRYTNDTDWDECGYLDYEGVKFSDLLSSANVSIEYLYDFGDSWSHKIEIVKILNGFEDSDFIGEYSNGPGFLTCLSGERHCPAEDSGGIQGYSQIIEILKNPMHEEYDEYITWLGKDFNPDFFDLTAVNNQLAGYTK